MYRLWVYSFDVGDVLLDNPRALISGIFRLAGYPIDNKSTIGLMQYSISSIQKAQSKIDRPVQEDFEIISESLTAEGSINYCAIIVEYVAYYHGITNTNDPQNWETIIHGYNTGPKYAPQVMEYVTVFSEFYDEGGYALR